MKRILIALMVSLALPVAVLAQNATMISMAQMVRNIRVLFLMTCVGATGHHQKTKKAR